MTETPVHSGAIPRLLIVDSNESHVAWLIDQLLGVFSIHKENLGPDLVTTVKTLAPALIILGEDEASDLRARFGPPSMIVSCGPRSTLYREFG